MLTVLFQTRISVHELFLHSNSGFTKMKLKERRKMDKDRETPKTTVNNFYDTDIIHRIYRTLSFSSVLFHTNGHICVKLGLHPHV